MKTPDGRIKPILDYLLEGCQIIGFDWAYLYLNDTAVLQSQLSKETLLGNKFNEIWPGIESSDLYKLIGDTLVNRVPHQFENEFLLPDGSKGWFDLRIRPVPEGAFVLSIDISERKIAEKLLKECEENYRNVFEFSPLAAMFWDVETRIIYWNKVAENVFGWKKDEVIGRKFIDFFIPEQDKTLVESYVDMLVRNIPRETTIIKNLKKDGSSIICEWNNTIIKDKDGNPATIISLAKDITERNHMEQELLRAKEKAEENDRLKSAFLRNVSHEIRTPLNAIIGFSELLNDPAISSNKIVQYTDIITKSGDQLLLIISDILDIAKIEAGQERLNETEINLNSNMLLVYEQFSLKAENKNIKLSFLTGLPDSESNFVTDENKLFQVLSNLISNALKYTLKGYVKFGYTIENHFIIFYVKDSGIGIPPNMYQEIFKSFRQAENALNINPEGTGLGLSISKANVDLLGGKIWLESELDKGTSFYFSIPCKRKTRNYIQ